MNPYSRTQFVLGEAAMQKLWDARVAVFGLGGVGGYVVEALARSGIGTLDLIDHDTISPTNINRQILATQQTIGRDKATVAAERVAAINPDIRVNAWKTFYLPETADSFDFTQYDYVVDAIDTVTGKLTLVEAAKAAGTPIISSMGTGNKLDATAFQVADISETSVCPLARIIRKECRKRGIDRLKVVYSTEDPIDTTLPPDDPAWAELPEGRNALPGSVCFVPAVAGMIIAGEVIKDIVKE
ncbi:MAG: tRNA threonylcarbamoyladenosine dehydratase [Oscillospiraceae bacterium]|nr:tRNA threonylcarbamoyladenosine dehydratase [Oscillospiraceae bacterium]